ncbi:hypothetical protein BJV77DRAFT_342033 [Russula vinacea]|nr:hypothetical protein BJV77DRAFT_342033 [Russula vinacea]
MQPAYTQQTHGQYPPTPRQNSDSGSPSRPRVSDYMTSGFSQRVESPYDTQSYTTGIYRDQPAVPSGPAYSNGVYVGPGYDFNDFNQVMAASWETPASQPLRNNSMPSISHNNLGQGETNYTGYHFGADQVPDPTMNFSPHFPGVNASQGSFPVWRFHDYWFTHVEQDELHLTVVLKKN